MAGSSTVEPALAVVTERVSAAYIARIKRRPLQKIGPLKDSIAAGNPEIRERFLATIARINYLSDLEQDCLRQHAERGYAEIGVDYSNGFKKVSILSQPQPQPQTQVMQQQGNDGGVRSSKATLSCLALLVVLLSFLLMMSRESVQV